VTNLPPTPPTPTDVTAKKPKSKVLIGLLSCGALFVLVLIIGALSPKRETAATGSTTTTGQATETTAAPATTSAPPVTEPAPTTEPPTTAPPTTAAPAETAGQKNARRSAQQYINTMPFSRAGLIHQLESSAGAGFAHEDAVYGADSLNADWNAQAVRAAKQYLDTMAFSRDGLIHQLESSAGAQFTHDEAVFGVNGAGL
jgi:hypothetical protein